jgi:hypothetical protein
MSGRFASVLLLLIAGLAGCGPLATSPSAPLALVPVDLAPSSAAERSLDGAPLLPGGLGGFVDLRDGRRTELQIRAYAWLEGGERELVDAWTSRHDMLGDRVIDGVSYRLEGLSDAAEPEQGVFETLYRQDRSGLYVWQEDAGPLGRDAIASEARRGALDGATVDRLIAAAGFTGETAAAYRRAAARIAARVDAVGRSGPPGGVGVSEITFLRYPLRPGASWVGRQEFNVWTVEGREVVATPWGRIGAWRLNIVLPRFFEANDRYQTWWAAPGEVFRRSHFETTATGETGAVLGAMFFEEEAELVTYRPGS